MVAESIMTQEPLRVTVPHQLEELLDLIHDEFFELASVDYSPSERRLAVPYRRIFHGGPARVVRNWILLRTVEVDVVRSRMIIRNVQQYECEDRARVGTYSFRTVSWDGETLLFHCEPDLELRLMVSDLDIESRDIGIRGKSRISHWFLVCQGVSGKVSD